MKLSQLLREAVIKEADNYELVSKLEEAQQHLWDAYNLCKDVVEETGDENARAYLLDHLRIMIDNDHGFLSSDFNMEKWKHSLLHPDRDDEDY